MTHTLNGVHIRVTYTAPHLEILYQAIVRTGPELGNIFMINMSSSSSERVKLFVKNQDDMIKHGREPSIDFTTRVLKTEVVNSFWRGKI